MIRTTQIRTALLSILAVLIIIMTLSILGTSNFNTPDQYPFIQLSDGWTITRGNNTWSLDQITDSTIGFVNKGDVITLRRTLPDIDIGPATIEYRTILSSSEVYVEDALIYSYGKDFIKANEMLLKMENFVQLPEDYAGKTISIMITSHEDNAFSGISPIYFGNYNDIKNHILQSRRGPLVIGIYMCQLGLLFLMLSPFLAFSDVKDISIFFGALTSISMGLYVLCFNDLFWYLSDNQAFFTFIEYLALFMTPTFILCYIFASGHVKPKLLVLIPIVVNIALSVVTAMLHFSNTIHICHFVSLFHAFTIIESVITISALIITSVKTALKERKIRLVFTSTNTLIVGLLLFMLCALIDILKYNILKFTHQGEINANINFSTLGAVVFIMCLLLDYFFNCIEYISESTVKSQLEGLAYTDPLTGLSNRAKCELLFASLTGNFTIVSLDLDYLKYTNDNYGHAYGDQLLTGFAELLKNSFTDASLIGRIGGDEYVCVLPYVDDERTQRDIDCLDDQMDHKNSSNSKLRFSASWGYASSTDSELHNKNDAKSVYLLADKRMYNMKNKHHKHTLNRLYDDLIGKLLSEGGDKNE